MGKTFRAEKEIAQAAARQHGNVTRAQLIAMGLDDAAIHRRVTAGSLHRVHRGVYAVGRRPVVPFERAAAAVLACGPGAALSHGSAMSLWGFWKDWRWPAEVTTALDRRPRGVRTYRSTNIARRDLTVQFGIRVTSPARTLLDCVPRLGDAALVRAVNDARLSTYLHMPQLTEVVARFRRHPGAARLAPLLGDTGGPTRSPLEDAFLPFCERFGLPTPEINTIVCGYEVDALFRAERLIVELDGYKFHSDRVTFESDRERDAHTLANGYLTVRITKERLEGDPAREADRLHAILRSRRAGAA
jgi:putative AbiEi antitoxin of type IV toxin-antitoxin system/uncharacterized protein DUF559